MEREREKTLTGDGDFRSKECIEFLKQSDIVITNPPFSLFREYIGQLIDYNKKFLVIGNMNAFAYKEIFPLFQNNKVWYGVTAAGKRLWFGVPAHYEFTGPDSDCRIDEHGRKFLRIKGIIRWYTNLDHKSRHEKLVLWARFDPNRHPKYDNYDAIEVSKTKEIPMDYDGVMGVPISFMDKYNPDQFEIVGRPSNDPNAVCKTKTYTYEEKQRLANGKDINAGVTLKQPDGTIKGLFVRILIRRRQ